MFKKTKKRAKTKIKYLSAAVSTVAALFIKPKKKQIQWDIIGEIAVASVLIALFAFGATKLIYQREITGTPFIAEQTETDQARITAVIQEEKPVEVEEPARTLNQKPVIEVTKPAAIEPVQEPKVQPIQQPKEQPIIKEQPKLPIQVPIQQEIQEPVVVEPLKEAAPLPPPSPAPQPQPVEKVESFIKFADCGDGFLDFSEQCDDENKITGDGCSSDCKLETTLGPKYQISISSIPAPDVNGNVNLSYSGSITFSYNSLPSNVDTTKEYKWNFDASKLSCTQNTANERELICTPNYIGDSSVNFVWHTKDGREWTSNTINIVLTPILLNYLGLILIGILL